MAIALVNHAYSDPAGSNSPVTVAMGTQITGNLNVVFVSWNDATHTISSVHDTAGNTYTLALGPTTYATIPSTSATYYCASIVGNAANTISVTFNAAAPGVDVRVSEWSGFSATPSVDVTSDTTGAGPTGTSGPVTTATAVELIIFGGYTDGGYSGAVGSGYTLIDITSPDSSVHVYQITTASGSFTPTATLGTFDHYQQQMVAFRQGSGVSTLRPGAVGAWGVSGTAIPHIPITPKASGSWGVTGTAVPHLVLRPKAAGLITVSGQASPSNFFIRPKAAGSWGVSGTAIPHLNQAFVFPGQPTPIGATIGIAGGVHGTIGTPNRIIVSGFVNPELVIRRQPAGTITVFGQVTPHFTGSALRPLASGLVTVSGLVHPEFNPLRPLAAGLVTVSGSVNPRFPSGGAAITPGARGSWGVTGTAIPHLILRVPIQGFILTTGGGTNPRLSLRPGSPTAITGLITASGLITPHLFVRPLPKGTISVTGHVNVSTTGILRPFPTGAWGVSGKVNPEFNPLVVQLTDGLILVSGLVTPHFTGGAPPVPPIIVTTSGYYVVEDVAQAYLVMYLIAGVNYADYAVKVLISGPFLTYQTALADLMLRASALTIG